MHFKIMIKLFNNFFDNACHNLNKYKLRNLYLPDELTHNEKWYYIVCVFLFKLFFRYMHWLLNVEMFFYFCFQLYCSTRLEPPISVPQLPPVYINWTIWRNYNNTFSSNRKAIMPWRRKDLAPPTKWFIIFKNCNCNYIIPLEC